MDLTTLLSTKAGKAIVGTAVAAAALGGLTAAGAVELPTQASEADPVTVTETPADPAEVVAQTPAAGIAEPQSEREDERTADDDETETEANEVEASSNEGGLGVDGEEVSDDAQDGGVDGQVISEDAIEGTPAEDNVPEDRGAPEDAGSQADEHRAEPELPEQAGAGAANRP